ncbi:uncharacterized protein conserved in bacteria [Hahella chejuensis KCTC 2396]|uniref:Uncharacterized protein conserved in bacteria n=1 Tax=Hahella chejuensis (strain KCTC 2396) TaxID=349521 RepID=Q2SIG9_HAHCH|nr:DUF1285 domain-containing protein [Hahella chejuensis]ABC29555.1 uncharacterized protein conserved in bacteria [Hahella chejuensis KCTC 2396]
MSEKYPLIRSATELSEQLTTIANAKRPPVETWNPTVEVSVDIRIQRDGKWFYQGNPIERMALVKLFASVLKKEGRDYFLVTPVEKAKIEVEDAPFVITAMERYQNDAGQPCIILTTNLDESALVSEKHPIRVQIDPITEEPSPYVGMRSGMEALIGRNVFYQLADLAEERVIGGESVYGVESVGVFFRLG